MWTWRGTPESNTPRRRGIRMVVELLVLSVLLLATVSAILNRDVWLARIELVAQAQSAVSGPPASRTSEVSDEALLRIVPLPSGAVLQGTTRTPDTSRPSGVVGIEMPGDVRAVSRAYDVALREVGWAFVRKDESLSAVTYGMSDPNVVAVVVYRQTSPRSTSIVVQIQ